MAKTALVISAHSADFVWRCGGAIALHEEKGYDVTVICLSYGERGESAKLWKNPGMTLEKVKSERRKEAENAAKALNVTDIQFFDLGDYPLVVDQDAKFKLVDVIRKVQPEFMLSHSKWDPYNTDHMYATQVAIEARMIAQAWGHNPGKRSSARRSSICSSRTRPNRWNGSRTSSSTSRPSGKRSGRPSSAWKARSTSGTSTRTSPKTAATISCAIPAARPADANRPMRKVSSRSSRAPSMNFEGSEF